MRLLSTPLVYLNLLFPVACTLATPIRTADTIRSVQGDPYAPAKLPIIHGRAASTHKTLYQVKLTLWRPTDSYYEEVAVTTQFAGNIRNVVEIDLPWFLPFLASAADGFRKPIESEELPNREMSFHITELMYRGPQSLSDPELGRPGSKTYQDRVLLVQSYYRVDVEFENPHQPEYDHTLYFSGEELLEHPTIKEPKAVFKFSGEGWGTLPRSGKRMRFIEFGTLDYEGKTMFGFPPEEMHYFSEQNSEWKENTEQIFEVPGTEGSLKVFRFYSGPGGEMGSKDGAKSHN
ncbi:hypothetical protein C8R42DRAFT_717766 [Lentinula raphanica]|nr:hypothetical protein C8R42DRAFT_717766 [Lentinula raphanica]